MLVAFSDLARPYNKSKYQCAGMISSCLASYSAFKSSRLQPSSDLTRPWNKSNYQCAGMLSCILFCFQYFSAPAILRKALGPGRKPLSFSLGVAAM